MFPHQVQRWRELVAANPGLRAEFEGHHLESIQLDFTRHLDDEPAPVELGRLYPPERVFGQPVDPNYLRDVVPMTVQGAPPVLRTFRNARIIGFSAVLTEEGAVHFSYVPRPANERQFAELNRWGAQGFISEEIDGRVVVRFAARPKPKRIRRHAIFFPNVELGNHGSFVFRQLPQMLCLAYMGIEADCYIVAERTAWTFEALKLLGFPDRPVYPVSHVSGEIFDQVTMCLMHDMDGFIRAETRSAARTLVARLGDAPGSAEPRKLFVSRDLQALAWPEYRPLLNEDEIAKLACASGFEIVRPETLTLRDQIRAFGAATHIMGPAGSGMLNAVFAPANARVVDIDSVGWARQHARIYASSGHIYSFVFGGFAVGREGPRHRLPWTVPEALVAEALDWCLG